MTASCIGNEAAGTPERTAPTPIIEPDAAARLEDLLLAEDTERTLAFVDVARWPNFPRRLKVFFIVVDHFWVAGLLGMLWNVMILL